MPRTSPKQLADQVEDARTRTLTLIQGLDRSQLMGPRLPIVNPLRWEIGHAAYFYEYWVLRRHCGEPPGRPDVDRLYDSITSPMTTAGTCPSPSCPRPWPTCEGCWSGCAQGC
jgi:gamma-glutamyl hercynylcysteine S-oxide synthase